MSADSKPTIPPDDPTGPQPDAEPDRLAQPVDTEQPPRLAFPIVAIGASAGGLEAYSEFLAAMRPDGGMAFVLIQHLPPDRESLIAEILARKTTMPVRQVEEGMVSPAVERVGPFETREEAEHALEILRANSAKWAEEEAAEE